MLKIMGGGGGGDGEVKAAKHYGDHEDAVRQRGDEWKHSLRCRFKGTREIKGASGGDWGVGGGS